MLKTISTIAKILAFPVRWFMPSQWEFTEIPFPIPSMTGFSKEERAREINKVFDRVTNKAKDMKLKRWKLKKAQQRGPYFIATFKRLK